MTKELLISRRAVLAGGMALGFGGLALRREPLRR